MAEVTAIDDTETDERLSPISSGVLSDNNDETVLSTIQKNFLEALTEDESFLDDAFQLPLELTTADKCVSTADFEGLLACQCGKDSATLEESLRREHALRTTAQKALRKLYEQHELLKCKATDLCTEKARLQNENERLKKQLEKFTDVRSQYEISLKEKISKNVEKQLAARVKMTSKKVQTLPHPAFPKTSRQISSLINLPKTSPRCGSRLSSFSRSKLNSKKKDKTTSKTTKRPPTVEAEQVLATNSSVDVLHSPEHEIELIEPPPMLDFTNDDSLKTAQSADHFVVGNNSLCEELLPQKSNQHSESTESKPCPETSKISPQLPTFPLETPQNDGLSESADLVELEQVRKRILEELGGDVTDMGSTVGGSDSTINLTSVAQHLATALDEQKPISRSGSELPDYEEMSTPPAELADQQNSQLLDCSDDERTEKSEEGEVTDTESEFRARATAGRCTLSSLSSRRSRHHQRDGNRQADCAKRQRAVGQTGETSDRKTNLIHGSTRNQRSSPSLRSSRSRNLRGQDIGAGAYREMGNRDRHYDQMEVRRTDRHSRSTSPRGERNRHHLLQASTERRRQSPLPPPLPPQRLRRSGGSRRTPGSPGDGRQGRQQVVRRRRSSSCSPSRSRPNQRSLTSRRSQRSPQPSLLDKRPPNYNQSQFPSRPSRRSPLGSSPAVRRPRARSPTPPISVNRQSNRSHQQMFKASDRRGAAPDGMKARKRRAIDDNSPSRVPVQRYRPDHESRKERDSFEQKRAPSDDSLISSSILSCSSNDVQPEPRGHHDNNDRLARSRSSSCSTTGSLTAVRSGDKQRLKKMVGSALTCKSGARHRPSANKH